MEVQWTSETKWTNCVFSSGGISIRATGQCINNRIGFSEFNDIGNSLTLGDSAMSQEGWQINNNLFNGCLRAVFATGAAGCQFTDNLVDHFVTNAIYSVSGTGGAGIPAYGWKITGNYMAATGDPTTKIAPEGIWLSNTVLTSPASLNTGNIIKNNEIFSYSGSTLLTGILLSGAAEVKNNVSGNKVLATVADVSSTSTDCIFTANEWLGAGFSTTVIAEYNNNVGIMLSSASLIKKTWGNASEYWGASMPSSGSYIIGDTVHMITPVIDGNNMCLVGWKRLVTGSAHVLGTDWANMYVSHTTPAN